MTHVTDKGPWHIPHFPRIDDFKLAYTVAPKLTAAALECSNCTSYM